MRRARFTAVSSALLVFLVAHAPCHSSSALDVGCADLGLSQIAVLISEFYPRGLCGDEYVVLLNAGSLTCNLRNWTLSDGEGAICFRSDYWLDAGRELSLSMNSSSFAAAFAHPPSVALDEPNSTLISITGTFRLGDQGDSLVLLTQGQSVADSVWYGEEGQAPAVWIGPAVPKPSQGEVLKRVAVGGRCLDTNCRDDWTPFREYRYGYTEASPLVIEVGPGKVTAFTAPDSALEILRDRSAAATREVRICAYEASSEELCASLLQALSRGVRVSVVVDGAPAGGISDDEMTFLSVLARAGADVRLISGNASRDIVQHVWHMHAKYAVFDGEHAVVLSENFVDSALPPGQLTGNRGWGVLASDPVIAQYLTALFDDDSRLTRPDVKEWRFDPRYDRDAMISNASVESEQRRVIEPLTSTLSSKVSVYVTPDCSVPSPFICSLLSGAGSILAEQFQTDLQWTTRWTGTPSTSPIVESMMACIRGGGNARVLFDSSWFNVERNSATCDYLRREATVAGRAGGFEMMDQGGPVQILHNKGFVIDGQVSVVSSNNWVFASFARNRELALVVDSPEIASFFAEAFNIDWYGDDTPPTADAGADIEVRLGDRVVLNGSLSSDNHVIASWSWDLYSDGQPDGASPCLEFYATKPGRFSATLTVYDPWGNRDTATVEFIVTPSQAASRDRGIWSLPAAQLFMAGLAGLASGLFIARRMWNRRRARLIVRYPIDEGQ